MKCVCGVCVCVCGVCVWCVCVCVCVCTAWCRYLHHSPVLLSEEDLPQSTECSSASDEPHHSRSQATQRCKHKGVHTPAPEGDGWVNVRQEGVGRVWGGREETGCSKVGGIGDVIE